MALHDAVMTRADDATVVKAHFDWRNLGDGEAV
jgi:mannose-1-phosphate guanylyltransferase